MPGRSLHLARRFVGSLRRGGPAPPDAEWASRHLLEGEAYLWQRMSDADRRHAVGVARRVDEQIPGTQRPVLAAALLHDVGKVTSGLGTWARVVATLVGAVTSSERHERWAVRNGVRGRLGRYLRHPSEGAALLAAAGSDPLTVAWAAEHHLQRERWTVDLKVAEALWNSDDD
ncbi:MAG: HD domain-containing protein [Actinobacteria bacterium]|nr:HD domain-containing protein [Actinomycetota bacterium]